MESCLRISSMMFRFMIDFSKVARFLTEEPFGNNQRQQQQGRFNRFNPGGFGTMAEDQFANLMKLQNPKSTIEQMGDSNILKTDIIKKTDGKSTGISVKATKDPSVPVSVNKANYQVGPRGSFRKMMMQGSDNDDLFTADNNFLNSEQGRNRLLDVIESDPAARAYLMSYGLGSRRRDGRNFDLKDLFGGTMSQNRLLERVSQRTDSPFLNPDELKEAFPDEFEALMNHLNDNKGDIFTQMVRQHQPKYPTNSYNYGDAKPIDLMAHIVSRAKYNRVFTSKGENRPPTHVDIRDVSDSGIQNAMENLEWFNDGSNFYLGSDETDDWNKRVLDINPMSKMVDAWTAKPGVRRNNFQMYPNLVKPGAQNTTMGVDEDMLNEVFGDPIYSRNVYSEADDDGSNEKITSLEYR